MFCSNCGKKISESAKFCRYCGFPQELDEDFTQEKNIPPPPKDEVPKKETLHSDTDTAPAATTKENRKIKNIPAILLSIIFIAGIILSPILIPWLSKKNDGKVIIDGIIYKFNDASKDYYVYDVEDPNLIEANIVSYIKDYPVTSIGHKTISGFNVTFENCKNLTNITIPSTITSIGSYAFRFCESLETIEIPNSVQSIGFGAFEWCKSLISITIPEGVIEISSSAFEFCLSLEEVNLPSTIKKIGSSAFESCESLVKINLTEGIESIGVRAFCDCISLTEIYLPDTITHIDRLAFFDCEKLQSLRIPKNIITIPEYMACNCKFSSVYIPKSVTTIEKYAFGYNSPDIYYEGTREQWENIVIEEGNQFLKTEKIFLNSYY